eukprot:NODE_629_length_2878_cov_7.846965.p1 GENE.NODE_629_length_2878_cov_7.846965~~NODE_629_length_2878_cov_7.846965.p1  ORF type:complete len:702 (+),score=220.91 NODE_629_length_2878_cov_7.846965:725-2830(+)
MQAAPVVKSTVAPAVVGDLGLAAEPVPVTGESQLLDIPQPLTQWLGKIYNEPQLRAITDSRKVAGITLVQGPPGTGKTTTILGILAALLSASAKEARGVSYLRTGDTRGRSAANGGTSNCDSESTESDSDEVIEQRRRERATILRSRAPWLQGEFVPWVETLEQELMVVSSVAARQPYPKLGPNDVVPMSEIAQEVSPQKVLVCAPSNAAIDEVLRRMVKDGIADGSGQTTRPAVTRCGPNVHTSLEAYSLEKIAKKRIAASCSAPDPNQQETEKRRILKNARVVCSTISISGSRDLVGYPEDFDTVVVDEASQGVEVSMLVPLKLGCRRLIMVGDPQQLPATCFSSAAIAHNYERSLFQRLQASQHRVNMLEMQYRMHPKISAFPSENFYDGLLQNVFPEAEYESRFPTKWSTIPCFAPVVFFQVLGTQRSSMQSLVNDDEADFVIHMFRMLSELYPDEPWRSKIAVISPYAEQVHLIRNKFRELFMLDTKTPCPVDVNTIDGFQGREKDCVIVSVVRANTESKSIGFVRDRRRMNVAFTRARTNLWVVGHAKKLSCNEDWKTFIQLQEKASRLLRVSAPPASFLARYLVKWQERHPDQQLPSSQMLTDAAAAGEIAAEAPPTDFTLTAEELEELEAAERERAFYDRDIEEVSDGVASDVSAEAADGGEEQLEAGAPPARPAAADVDNAEAGEVEKTADG